MILFHISDKTAITFFFFFGPFPLSKIRKKTFFVKIVFDSCYLNLFNNNNSPIFIVIIKYIKKRKKEQKKKRTKEKNVKTNRNRRAERESNNHIINASV